MGDAKVTVKNQQTGVSQSVMTTLRGNVQLTQHAAGGVHGDGGIERLQGRR